MHIFNVKCLFVFGVYVLVNDAERFHELYESHDHVLYFSCIVLMGVFKNSTDFVVCYAIHFCSVCCLVLILK